MVRKDALCKAIEIIEKTQSDRQEKEEIIAGLKLCLQELPFSHWSEAAIFDACDQWVQEHGELHIQAFVSAAMPSHPTIKNRFGMTAKEFRDRYYPLPGEKSRSPYSSHDRSYWDAAFIEEFHRLQIRSQEDYNRRRDKSHPSWATLASMHGFANWGELLEKLGLQTYGRQHQRPAVHVRLIEDDMFVQ